MSERIRSSHDYLFTLEVRGPWVEATRNQAGHFDWSREAQVEAIDMEQAAFKLKMKRNDLRYKHKVIIGR